MIKSFKTLFHILPQAERRKLFPLGIAMLITALLEIVSIGSLGPFVAVLSDPGIIDRNPILRTLWSIGNFQTLTGFLAVFGALIVGFLIVATSFKAYTLYQIYRFSARQREILSRDLFLCYLQRPYAAYLNVNTTELSKNILAEVDQVVGGILLPSVESAARLTISVGIGVLLIATDWIVATLSIFAFSLAYLILYYAVRPKLARHGDRMRCANAERFRVAGEAFGAIKDVKLLGVERFFGAQFAFGAGDFARAEAARQIITSVPQIVILSISVAFAIAVSVILFVVSGSLTTVLPVVAMYGFALQRLVPNLHFVYHGLSQMRYFQQSLEVLARDLSDSPAELDAVAADRDTVRFVSAIHMADVDFAYPGNRELTLKKVNLAINKNTTVALVGQTGCGKTTLVDVLMGILTPTAGSIRCDGSPVITQHFETEDEVRASDIERRHWMNLFGYVPQTISISDDSVAANIAFGIEKHLWNRSAIERAAKLANIHEFVTTELPDGYETRVGEKGIRLSGGQRQRLGIARALYRDPPVLILDEATSALDSVTEDVVMDAIQTLMHDKTIIVIAHRITTVRNADKICIVDQGRIVDEGSYEELVQHSARFQRLAKDLVHKA